MFFCIGLAVGLLVNTVCFAFGDPNEKMPADAGELQFNRDIRPILAEKCYFCHGNDPKHRMADLRLDVREEAIAAGAIVPEDPDGSLLIERILEDDPDIKMPPPESHKQISEREAQMLRRWIKQGAAYQPHWAFVAPRRAELSGTNAEHPIDHFIRAELAGHGLEPSPPAAPETLIRRVSLDLIGLPPTVAELDAFLAEYERNPDVAYRELIERLLASPHYGERWGRWWLDQARYADSNGYSIDAPREIWKYRDWVIDALNQDMPFDQFTIEQLAGDLLPEATVDQKIATGFHRNTQINQEGGIDPEQFRIDSVFDRVATTGTVWLGLTVGCAQCHDHKFDPIEQKEYYRLFAFFNNQDEPKLKVYDPDIDPDALAAERKTIQAEISRLIEQNREWLKQWEDSLDDAATKQLGKSTQKALQVEASKRTTSQWETLLKSAGDRPETWDEKHWKTLTDRRAAIDKLLSDVPTTLVLRERSEPRVTTVFINGDFTRPDEEVTPGVPAIMHPLEGSDKADERSDRLDLARWIVDPSNPLTARVIVNRVWQQYFGRGLVETENDFGMQGSPPSHPELLDWLALELVDKRWSVKELHRTILTSQTYRQSSVRRPIHAKLDPENYLLSHQRRLRLDAEIIRDVALSVSGKLAPKLGGPSVFPPIPDGVMGQGQIKRAWRVSRGEDRYRRALYTFVYRGSPPPALSVFDAPEGRSTCTRRIRSNTPLQSLTLMNDASFFELAESLEQIIRRDGLEHAFRRCTARVPTTQELAVLEKLDPLNAARVLLNLDETVTRE